MITKQYLTERIQALSAAYDQTVEKLGNIAGAIQEAKFLLSKLEEQEKKEDKMACTGKGKGGKKK